MGEGGTLKVLLWKHFMVRKRRYVHTIIELASPLFLFLIFFLLRNMIHPVMKSHAEEKLYEIHRTETKPLNNPTVRSPYTILYSPDNEHTQRIMEVVGEKLRLPKLTQFPGTLSRGYYGFSNDTNIVDFVKEMDESQAIVLFQDMEEKWPRHLNYTIRMKTDFMTQLYHSFDLGISHERFGTIYNGFMLLQWTIDSSYLYLLTGENVNQTVSLQEFPYAESAQNAVMEQVVILLQLACYGSLAIPFVFLMSRLLTERTSGVQELMKLAGVSVNMLGVSHFLNVLPTGLVYSVGGAIFVKVSSNPLVPESNGFLIFLALLLHFVTVMALAFVFSYILKSTQYAVSVSSLVYVVSRVISSLLDNPKLPKVALVPAAIMPHMPMYWFWGEVGALEVYGGAVSFSTMSSSHSQPGVSVLACYALMLLQASLLFLFAWYLSLVRPGNYGVARPWNFCFKKRVTPDKLTDEAEEEPIARDNRFFEKIPSNADVGIQISNVTKVFDKQVALSNVSFEVLRGEITVLLGHNGAGKTTLMSIITGMYSANEGSILVGGHEVSRGGAKARLGLCPQHNLFFPDLTVMEHVVFFSMLKGQTYSQAQNSGKALLKKLGIGEKANAQSGQLSGGMKRRLQLACALAGDADVLVLDEPTSGLDVETRRELWDLLLSLRGSRTLLLSTHFMEEADALGDRVAALHQGRLRCHATPLYLKKNIGTGYRLTLTTIGLPKEDHISALVTSHVPDATLKEKSLNTISFSLPAASSSRFPELFAQLEEKRSEMGVDSIGVGVSTLEEVFLKLCSNVDTTFSDDAVDSSVPEATYNRHTGLLLVVQQMLILMKRHIQFLMFKKWHFSIMQVILPVALVFVFTHLTNEVQSQQSQTNPKVSLDLDLFRDMPDRRVYYHVSNDGPLRSLADTYPDVEFQVTNDVGEAVLRVSQTDMLEYNKYLAGVEINDTDAKVLYTTRVRHAAPVALNLLSNMLAAQLIPWADGRTFTTNNYPLQGAFVPLQDKTYVQTKSTSGAAMWVFFVVFLILGAVMNAVALPCSERQSGARHLHVMAGCAAGTHWAATLLLHCSLYVAVLVLPTMLAAGVVDRDGLFTQAGFLGVTLRQGQDRPKATLLLHCSLYVAVLVLPTMLAAGVVDRDGLFTQAGFLGSLFVSLTLGIAAFLALTYLVSFFVGERGAGAVLFVIILVLGVIPALVKTGADLFDEDLGRWRFPLALSNYVVPPNALTSALLRSVHVASSNAVCSLNRDHCPNLYLSAEEIVKCCDQNQNPRCYFCSESYAPSMDWIILVFQLIVYMTLVLCAQHGFFHWLWDRATNKGYHPTAPGFSDEMVRAETTYVNKAITLPNKQVPDAMLVNDVHKRYPAIFRKTCNAVKGISFSVKKGECFGVLGVNGAGKSTTFKMITAEECTTRGSVFANGHHLKYPRAKYLESLGYCPQFFGLDDFLTGRDNLTLLLTLRGLPMDHVAQQVKSWIAVVGLEKYAGLPVEGYSGGCKRRLAAAAALCGGAPVTLLDEPTAGVDVAARRRVWAALRRGLAAGRALIITSHSMDEMEALCARIAIVSRGELAALGSAAALRAAHASGHAVVLKIAAPAVHGDVTDGAEPEVQNLKAKLHEKFNCSLKDEHKTMLHYHINETMRYSDIFKGLEQLKAMYPDLIEDYSVTETTLEEVFLSFANDAQTPENPVARV